MNCAQAQPHLEIHADGELAASVRPDVEAHLRSCESCRKTVERWRSLRRCAGRAFSAGVPQGLDSRVAAMLASQRGGALRRARLRNGALAVAALLLVGVGFWRFNGYGIPGGIGGSGGNPPIIAAVPAVDPTMMANTHNYCTGDAGMAGKIHDEFRMHGSTPNAARDALADHVACKLLLPDLQAAGYTLDGACRCFPCGEVKAVHAYYRNAAGKTISVFSVAGKVTLASCKTALGSGRSPRQYEEATAKGVNIVKWDECSASYAVCGTLEMDKLQKLTDSDDFNVVAIPLPQDGLLSQPKLARLAAP